MMFVRSLSMVSSETCLVMEMRSVARCVCTKICSVLHRDCKLLTVRNASTASAVSLLTRTMLRSARHERERRTPSNGQEQFLPLSRTMHRSRPCLHCPVRSRVSWRCFKRDRAPLLSLAPSFGQAARERAWPLASHSPRGSRRC